MNAELVNITKEHKKEILELYDKSIISFKKIKEITDIHLVIPSNTTLDFIPSIKQYIEENFKDEVILETFNQYTQFLEKHFLNIIMAFRIELKENNDLQDEGIHEINLFSLFSFFRKNTFFNSELERVFMNPEKKDRIYISLLRSYFKTILEMQSSGEPSSNNIIDQLRELIQTFEKKMLEIQQEPKSKHAIIVLDFFRNNQGLNWNQISILLHYERTGNPKIEFITEIGSSGKLSLDAAGFIDNRSKGSNLNWDCLQDLAEGKWYRLSRLAKADGSLNDVTDKRLSLLNKHLKTLTGIKEKFYIRLQKQFPEPKFTLTIKNNF
ncbi:MAG: hypothetical protein PF570_06780 [Candidatus Cloacimonetes bacterium]|jgi:hypothetical protein|nr:hypothetical protein [Candidatus Cloacimonadota bacterium]